MMSKKEPIYSFSKMTSFDECRRGYYYNYIKKAGNFDNIYSFLGSTLHNLTQGMILGIETNESSLQKFAEAIEDAEMLDLQWLSESTKNKFVECINHYLMNYTPISNSSVKIEEHFMIDIDGIKVQGYIDIWYRVENKIYIIDLKTSSKFSKKDLVHKQRQLLLYAIALGEKYPEYEIILCFDMMKYALNKRGTLIERNKFDLFDDYRDAIVHIDPTPELIQETKDWVKDVVGRIDEMDKEDDSQWLMDRDPNKDFFCRNLCSHVDKCKMFG